MFFFPPGRRGLRTSFRQLLLWRPHAAPTLAFNLEDQYRRERSLAPGATLAFASPLFIPPTPLAALTSARFQDCDLHNRCSHQFVEKRKKKYKIIITSAPRPPDDSAHPLKCEKGRKKTNKKKRLGMIYLASAVLLSPSDRRCRRGCCKPVTAKDRGRVVCLDFAPADRLYACCRCPWLSVDSRCYDRSRKRSKSRGRPGCVCVFVNRC